jgi:hypothetical protein
VEERLTKAGFESYLPLQTKLKQWSDRKKKVKVPVLPSMILVHIENVKRDTVFNRANAVRYLYWLGQPAIVTPEEVEGLKSLTENSEFENQGLQKLKRGKKLDMTALGFDQIQGTVTYVNANECWVVLENLGYIVKFKNHN